MSVALLSQARKSECGMAHNTLVDLKFVRTVSIPNLSLLPCLEVALIFFSTNELTKRTKPYIEAACCLKMIGYLLVGYPFWAGGKIGVTPKKNS